MSKEEEGRIKLFDIITKDKNKIMVKEVAQIFCTLFGEYFESTKTGKAVRKKLTEEEFIAYFTGFVNSFLSSLYASASKNEEEFKKRVNEVHEANQDVLVKQKYN